MVDKMTDTMVKLIVRNCGLNKTVEDNSFTKVLKVTLETFYSTSQHQNVQ